MKGLRTALLRWYDAERRDLPWRRSRDPYSVWISETMLQQTRVETVIPYYERFLARFPTLESLADAELEDVYTLWTGLGYYSRARNLHAAARKVQDEFAGELPDEAEALRSLPGIGRYTSGALASIAFDREEPVVDGNVARVLTRLLGIRKDVKSRAVQERLWEEAGALARGPRPGDLNQALMELGATRCTPRSPRCSACPLARRCDARAKGDAESLPVKKRRAPPRRMRAVAAWLPRRAQVLAVRRPPGGLLGGLWQLPGDELRKDEPAQAGLARVLREGVGLRISNAVSVGAVEHVFTHRRLELEVFRCASPEGRVRLRGFDAHRWLVPDRLGALAQGGATRKALDLLRASAKQDERPRFAPSRPA